ncbi:MAG TPA: ParA family partition ATPase [Denitromonas sp.]|uniref:ParA family partition ATPase n=1 Tax=Denitromonas sp. TaxID=2734609 RepID=UPI001DBE388B|nr:ParA family protein [Rhodocyclaceae bacterium]MCP5221700.1 ParA family protein [Zoogloeaceae bacterium]HPR05831.1 ParA family partition ATPase [Denitromonas sp.]HQU90230.1 ParA family partition ATPase [Denitromonas sp.]HQV16567.1 ParA family partition ATPase [Denitromonas sp.]
MARAPIITLISQKGGAGKTTVTMQLAAGLARRGRKVEVVDLDMQESASRWAAAASPEHPFPARMHRFSDDPRELAEKLAKWRKRADVVLLDCPPSIDHPRTLAALNHTDLAIIPVVPSPTDLWSTRAVERLIVALQATHPGLQGVLVPNRVTRTSLAADVMEVMHEFDLPVLSAILNQRNAYAQSAAVGGSVFDLGSAAQPAQLEVLRLVSAVVKRLGGGE